MNYHRYVIGVGLTGGVEVDSVHVAGENFVVLDRSVPRQSPRTPPVPHHLQSVLIIGM